MLDIGTKVKDFTLLDDEGAEFKFSDNLGKKFVIYFYPKDNTPGCTTQACEFRDSYHRFKEMDVDVIGISADSVESHKKFKEKYDLPFKLLADTEREVIEQFEVAKKPTGIKRSTFIIDEEGKVEKVYEKAIPSENAGEIIDYLNK